MAVHLEGAPAARVVTTAAALADPLALIEGARDGRAHTQTLPTILSAGLYRRWP